MHINLNEPGLPVNRILLISSFLLLILLNVIGAPLVNSVAPAGIVSFELAGDLRQAEKILGSWNERARLLAAFSLGLDYLFMLVYASALYRACRWSGQILARQNAWIGLWWRVPALAAWVAAQLDGLENFGLALILIENAGAPWPEIVGWCAMAKFGLLLFSLGYFLSGIMLALIRRRTSGKFA